MSIYTGYIYLWYDTKAKFFYLGGHKGTVEDTYICSNKMMMHAYKKRPKTFRFKVLQYVYGGLDDLRNAEQLWLDMIKDTELYWTPNIYNKTVRYYNQKKLSRGGSRKGHTKNRIKPIWNKGYSKVEVELRRNGLLSFIPLDRPQIKNKPHKKLTKPTKPRLFIIKTLYTKKCPACESEFTTYVEKQKNCSKECAGFKIGKPSWNKGLPNPQAKINGIKSALKQSQTVTGRKKKIRDDGTWYWVYPEK